MTEKAGKLIIVLMDGAQAGTKNMEKVNGFKDLRRLGNWGPALFWPV